MEKKKILFTDLDGTLINTISGSTFPKGIWDMNFDYELLDKIKKYGFKSIYIITNQGGIESGFININSWINKIKYVCNCIEEYTGIRCDFDVCSTNDKNDNRRKPNIGMITDYFANSMNYYEKKDSLMIGDASGLDGQFSDSDKKCAEKAGIDYLDVSEFKQL